jgi:hypothetical protein
LFRTEVKEDITAREQVFGQPGLLDDHYGHKFRWEAGKEKPNYLLDNEEQRPAKRQKI